jgi:probable phosphomutase (TIGR03848 family)
MTRFLLVRHAAHDWLGKGMAGRMPDVSLNPWGREQAQALATRLDGVPIDAIYSSPQPRTLQTAAAVAARRGLHVAVDAGFDEVDFGRWTGRTFEQLRTEPLWGSWVHRRSAATPPGGEPFAGVQLRARDTLERLARRHPEQAVVAVSHGDVIKALLAHFLGISLDHLERFDIDPASVSLVDLGADWSKVRLVNGPNP